MQIRLSTNVIMTSVTDFVFKELGRVSDGEKLQVYLGEWYTPFTFEEREQQLRTALGLFNKDVVVHYGTPQEPMKSISHTCSLKDWIESDTREDLYEHLPIEVQNWLTQWRKEREVLLSFIYS